MPPSLNDVLVLVAPLYLMMLDIWRRLWQNDADALVDGDLAEVEEDLEELIEERVEEVEQSNEEDMARLMAMMNELHDDAKVIHDNIIDHNPCAAARSDRGCPFCKEGGGGG